VNKSATFKVKLNNAGVSIFITVIDSTPRSILWHGRKYGEEFKTAMDKLVAEYNQWLAGEGEVTADIPESCYVPKDGELVRVDSIRKALDTIITEEK